ncbi:MAG TPA: hypothetical protein VGH47_08695 [Xanthobacteraceae bacterium]
MSQDGRFEIKWKTTPVPTGASEPPASADLSRGEPASTGEPVPRGRIDADETMRALMRN